MKIEISFAEANFCKIPFEVKDDALASFFAILRAAYAGEGYRAEITTKKEEKEDPDGKDV